MKHSPRADFVRLLRLAAPFKGWMLLSALLGFATIGSSIGLMSAAAWIIASAALHPPISTLNLAIVGVRFFGIARGVFRYLERYVSHQTTFRLLARLRVWFYDGVEPLAPARLTQHRSGDLLARVVADIDTLENIYLRVIAPPLIALLVAASMAVFMAWTDLRLALALVGCLALAGIGLQLLVGWLGRDSGDSLVTMRSELTIALIDGVQGLADLVAYGAQQRHAAQVTHLNRALAGQQAHMARIAALQTALLGLITSLAAMLVLIIAIPLVHSGTLDGVMLAVLVLAAITSFEAVQPLPAAFQHLGSNLDAARRLFEIVDTAPAVTDPAYPVPLPAPAELPDPVLTVEDLHFRYSPDDPPALNGVSFALSPGDTLAIVGASGAGKSTLINLLLRFWNYDTGTITLAGHDMRAYAQDDVRALFSVVSQHTYLFGGTIEDNLRLASPTASDDDLLRAARAAQLHDAIAALPHEYDTWIGEQGLMLSGGERQRLAIARAILKDAPLLLLDEPTANLDPVTERAVLDTIFTTLAGRTILLITHRLVGLERARAILVLHDGRFVERGRHADLLQIDGHYRRLWAHQQGVLAQPGDTRLN